MKINMRKKKLSKQDLMANNPSQDLLIRLLEMYQNGRYREAEKLATSISQEFPKHQFAWKVLGAVLRALGRKSDALNVNRTAVVLSPQDVEAHNNLGNTLSDLGRLEEARTSFAKALALDPDYAEAHNNLGLTLQQLGKLDGAVASCNRAILLKPDYTEAHNNLGITLQGLGRVDEAMASYNQAISLKPDYADAHSNLGNTLKEKGRLDEAKASYSQAIVLKPDFTEAHRNLGTTLQELGRLEEAEASYRRAIALNPEDPNTHYQLLMCLFLQDKESDFFEELDYLVNQELASAIVGSLACRSALKYGLEKPNLFCIKPLNYVLHSDLAARCDFDQVFVKKAKSILNEEQISNREQLLLVNGTQTSGNIFDIKNDDTNEIQNIIREEVEKYREKFKQSEEGLIKKMPTNYSLYGWFISLKSGGNLKPHIHTDGWLSGSIYINVPERLEGDSGNLVVSLGEENDASDTRMNKKKSINVATGSLVLFPASLMHHTIPFESDEERVVLAFDVKRND